MERAMMMPLSKQNIKFSVKQSKDNEDSEIEDIIEEKRNKIDEILQGFKEKLEIFDQQNLQQKRIIQSQLQQTSDIDREYLVS